MSKIQIRKTQAHIGSLIASVFFVLAGLVTLYDTTSYSDVDSKVFPQAVAIILIICAVISFITTIINPISEGGFGQGIWWRRLLLVITMLLTCFAMPYVGFLAAGVIAFCGGLIAAMHDPWSSRTMFLYGGIGVLVMTTFYMLFRYVLHVPLP